MADRPCKQAPIEQISTGEAGPQVNRDLEVLFAAVNKLIRCVSKTSDFLDQTSGGSFGGGSGSVGSGGAGPEVGTNSTPAGMLVISTGSALTLPDFFEGFVYIEATANLNVTLGAPAPNRKVTIQETGGAFNLTIKNDGGTTIGSVNAGQVADIRSFLDAAGAPSWQSGIAAMGPTGIVYVPADIVFRAGHPVTKDTTDGHYEEHRITADVMVPNDLGTTSEPT